jgi:hypothetical protein
MALRDRQTGWQGSLGHNGSSLPIHRRRVSKITTDVRRSNVDDKST